MSIELKQAAEQALKELGEARKIVRASSSRQLAKDWDRRATDALANLRATIQQPATPEPVVGVGQSKNRHWSAALADDLVASGDVMRECITAQAKKETP